MQLILLGLPGSGKTTQAIALSQLCKAVRLSVTNRINWSLFDLTDRRTSFKHKLWQQRMLSPDLLSLSILQTDLVRLPHQQRWVLDDFPHNTCQARALDLLLADAQQPCSHAVYLDVATEVAVQRLTALVPDSDPHELRSYLNAQRTYLLPLLEHYHQDGRLVWVDANRSIDRVQIQMSSILQLV